MTLTAAYKLATPAFLGGADNQAETLRPPSIKGALRFWWRALAWGRMLADAKANGKKEANALSVLHGEEGRLFGSAAGEGGGGQGVFLLRMKVDQTTEFDQNKLAALIAGDPWLAYLAGPGLTKSGRLDRNRNAIKGWFELECRFRRPRIHENADDDRLQIAQALWLLGALGGLGSRARRGWGSLSLQGMSDDAKQSMLDEAKLFAPTNVAELENTLAGMLGQPASSCPPFSAFSKESRIDVWSKSGSTAMDILSMAGHEFLRYRGYGWKRGGKHLIGAHKDGQGKWVGEPARKNFHLDHDLGVAVYEETYQSGSPARMVFGLPHKLRFSDAKADCDVSFQPAVQPVEDATSPERRASPLLMHVHSFPGCNTALIQTFLPAQFLPADVKQIAMQRDERKMSTRSNGTIRPYKAPGPIYLGDAQPDWNEVRRYLDAHDRVSKNLAHEFPDRQTIWPVPTGASTP